MILYYLYVQARSNLTLLRYTVKIINPENKGGFITQEFQGMEFSTVESVRSKLAELFGKYTNEKPKQQKRPNEYSDTPSTSQTKRAKACESHLEN